MPVCKPWCTWLVRLTSELRRASCVYFACACIQARVIARSLNRLPTQSQWIKVVGGQARGPGPALHPRHLRGIREARSIRNRFYEASAKWIFCRFADDRCLRIAGDAYTYCLVLTARQCSQLRNLCCVDRFNPKDTNTTSSFSKLRTVETDCKKRST